jgi:hypothetical protein
MQLSFHMTETHHTLAQPDLSQWQGTHLLNKLKFSWAQLTYVMCDEEQIYQLTPQRTVATLNAQHFITTHNITPNTNTLSYLIKKTGSILKDICFKDDSPLT